MYRTFFLLLCCVSLSFQYKQACNNTTDCPANAHCGNGACYCNDQYVDDQQDSLNCLRIAQNVTDRCVDKAQCTTGLGAHATCKFTNPNDNSTGYCGCVENSHYFAGICYQSVLIGGNCTDSNQCFSRTRNINVTCFSGQCTCPVGTHPSVDRGDCIQNSVLGGYCNTNSDCATQYSVCEGVCRCKLGFTPNLNKTACLLALVNLGDQCAEDTQCQALMENTVCLQNNTCGCNQQSHQVNSSCLISVSLGGNCLSDFECVTKSMNFTRSGCLGGVCQCRKGYRQIKNDCSAGIRVLGFDSKTFIWLLITSLAASLLRTKSC